LSRVEVSIWEGIRRGLLLLRRYSLSDNVDLPFANGTPAASRSIDLKVSGFMASGILPRDKKNKKSMQEHCRTLVNYCWRLAEGGFGGLGYASGEMSPHTEHQLNTTKPTAGRSVGHCTGGGSPISLNSHALESLPDRRFRRTDQEPKSLDDGLVDVKQMWVFLWVNSRLVAVGQPRLCDRQRCS